MVARNFCSVKVLLITTAALVVILVGVLILAFVGIPLIVDDQLEKSVRLKEGTVQWDRFVETPFGLDLKVWLFNVTNPDEILKGEKPILNEVGPYHYIESRKKDILSTDSEEDSVTYEQHLSIKFNESLSGDLREDDELVLLNPVLVSISQVTSALERMVLGGCLDKIFIPAYNKLFVKVKVRTILFDGFEFAVNNGDLGIACAIVRQKVLEKATVIRNIDSIYSDTDPSQISSLKFSFLNYKVRAPDGTYTVIRGLDDVSQLGKIIRWNESPELPYWGRIESINNDTCHQVRGSDATIYPPDVSKSDSFDIFATDVCRVVKITYTGKDTYQGVDAYRFETNEDTLRFATTSPENDCYCTKETSNGDGTPSCFLDGLVDIKPCVGAPILLSFPHFLYADKKYMKEIGGIEEADELQHKIYLLVEPNTGTPLEGKKRVQFNSVLRPTSFLELTENVPKVVLPLIWVEEGASLPSDLVDELNSKYFHKIKILDGVKYALIAVFIAAVLVSAGFFIRKKFFSGK